MRYEQFDCTMVAVQYSAHRGAVSWPLSWPHSQTLLRRGPNKHKGGNIRCSALVMYGNWQNYASLELNADALVRAQCSVRYRLVFAYACPHAQSRYLQIRASEAATASK